MLNINQKLKKEIKNSINSYNISSFINQRVHYFFKQVGFSQDLANEYRETMNKYQLDSIEITPEKYPKKYKNDFLESKLNVLEKELKSLTTILKQLDKFKEKYNENLRIQKEKMISFCKEQIVSKNALQKQLCRMTNTNIYGLLSDAIDDCFIYMEKEVRKIYQCNLSLIFNQKVFISKDKSSMNKFSFLQKLSKRENQSVHEFLTDYFYNDYKVYFYVIKNKTKYEFYKDSYGLNKVAKKNKIMSKKELSNLEFNSFISSLAFPYTERNKNFQGDSSLNKVLSLYQMIDDEREYFLNIKEKKDITKDILFGIDVQTTELLTELDVSSKELHFEVVPKFQNKNNESTAIISIIGNGYELNFDFIENDNFRIIN